MMMVVMSQCRMMMMSVRLMMRQMCRMHRMRRQRMMCMCRKCLMSRDCGVRLMCCVRVVCFDQRQIDSGRMQHCVAGAGRHCTAVAAGVRVSSVRMRFGRRQCVQRVCMSQIGCGRNQRCGLQWTVRIIETVRTVTSGRTVVTRVQLRLGTLLLRLLFGGRHWRAIVMAVAVIVARLLVIAAAAAVVVRFGMRRDVRLIVVHVIVNLIL